MSRKFALILVLLYLNTNCKQSEKIEKPDDLLSEAKMADVLFDLFTINAAKGVSRNLLETNGFEPEAYILNKHNIDSTQFANSNAYYAFNTEIYKGIIEDVKSKLEIEKERYEKLKEEEALVVKKRRDSIRKAKITNQKKKSIPLKDALIKSGKKKS